MRSFTRFATFLGAVRCCTALSALRSWSELRASARPPAPRLFEAEERLFGWADAEVVFWRDAAGWCPFCEITWLVLEAMAVPYRMRTVPLRCYMLDGEQKDLEYTAAVGPEGVVPAVQFRTSAAGYGPPVQSVERIFDELRRRYPSRFPAGDAAVRARACEGEGSVFGRLRVARRSYEACAGARRSELSVLEPLASALTDLDALLEEAEAAAATRGGDGPEGARPQGLWLDGGSSAGVADLMLLPLLERTAAVVPYFFGDGALAGLRFGRAEASLRRARASHAVYAAVCSDATTLARTNLRYAMAGATPRYGVPALEVDAAAASLIDGTSTGACDVWAAEATADARGEAAARLAACPARVAAFARRCAMLPADPEALEASAALAAAPAAPPGAHRAACDDIEGGVVTSALAADGDALSEALRAVASLLLLPSSPTGDPPSSLRTEAGAAAEAFREVHGSAAAAAAAAAMAALALNVGVPRDMEVEAARALRSHARILGDALRDCA